MTKTALFLVACFMSSSHDRFILFICKNNFTSYVRPMLPAGKKYPVRLCKRQSKTLTVRLKNTAHLHTTYISEYKLIGKRRFERCITRRIQCGTDRVAILVTLKLSWQFRSVKMFLTKKEKYWCQIHLKKVRSLTSPSCLIQIYRKLTLWGRGGWGKIIKQL